MELILLAYFKTSCSRAVFTVRSSVMRLNKASVASIFVAPSAASNSAPKPSVTSPLSEFTPFNTYILVSNAFKYPSNSSAYITSSTRYRSANDSRVSMAPIQIAYSSGSLGTNSVDFPVLASNAP